MAMEAIKQVTQTEQDAQKRRDAAVSEGRLQVAQAQKQARTMLDESRQQAEFQVKQMMQEAENQAAQLTQEILAAAGTECEKMKEQARQRLDQAAARIVEKVVNG